MEMTNINSMKQRSSIDHTKDHANQADTSNHEEISSIGDQSPVTTHSKRCKWSSWLVTIIILLVVITVLTVVVLAVLLPVLKLELSDTDTSTSPSPIIYTESPWTINTIDPESAFPTATIDVTVADDTTPTFPAPDLNIDVSSIYQLPEMSAIFVKSFIKSAYDSISFTVIEKKQLSRGFLIDFTVNHCQELDVDRVVVSKPISLDVTIPTQSVDVGYYLNGSSLTYSITPSQAIVSSSCDCPAILVIYDDLEIYTEFLNQKTDIQTGFLFKFCLNRNRLSAKIELDKNSYLYAGLVICATSVPTSINLHITGIANQYNIHEIADKSISTCTVIFYDGNIKRCTISLSTSITVTEEKDELCVVALVSPRGNGKQCTPDFFVLVCAIIIIIAHT